MTFVSLPALRGLVFSGALAGACITTGPVAIAAQAADWTVDAASIMESSELYEGVPFGLSGFAAVRLLPDGRVAVARRESSEIQIYSPDGRVERVLGGPGTGQLTYVTGLSVAAPDTILAYDVFEQGALRLTRFLVTGERLGSEQIGVTDGLGATYQGTLGTGTPIGSWSKAVPFPLGTSAETSDSVRIGLFNRDTVPNVLATTPGIRRQGSPVHFSPHVVVAVVGDTVFYSDGIDGLVQAVVPGGSLARSFRLPIEAWTPDAAYARLEPELDDPALNPDRYDLGRGDVVPTISDMLAGPEGRLWVKVYDPATDSHTLARPRTGGEWLVIDTQGTVEARVAVPDGFRLMDVGPDRITGIIRSEDGERVAVFPLTRRRPAA